MHTSSLKPYAWLSVGAACATILLKALAWWMTDSVGLLSDALESIANLAGALMALAMIGLAEQPADANHTYGHGKAEYFSGGFEGLLILVAAVAISVTAIERLIHPQGLQQIGLGLAISSFASVINLFTARILLKVGREHRSMALEADAHHLMTDVWTSVGVIVGVAAAAYTGWLWLDPLLALCVALNIVWMAWQLLRRSASGLMDVALPPEDHALLLTTLAPYKTQDVDYHALRTRESGARRFVELHLLVPGEWTVKAGHDLAEQLESDVRQALPNTTVSTHIEPIEDPLSHEDIALDR